MPRTPRSSSGASVRLSQRLMPTTAMAAMARGLLTLRPTLTTAMEDMVDTDSVMAGTATAVSATAMARGLLMLMPFMAMEDMADTVLATPLAMVLAMVMAAMARGLLTLRPTPTTATLDMVDTDSVMAGTATAVSATAMARGLLMLMPTTAMGDMVLA